MLCSVIANTFCWKKCCRMKIWQLAPVATLFIHSKVSFLTNVVVKAVFLKTDGDLKEILIIKKDY